MNFNFFFWNRLLGITVFLVALTTYSLTVEPTVSFWDTGEYIATSSNLEVGHPPGAPLFQMMGAFFSIFASDLSQIALMVNLMSVFAASFTILFLFRSIVLLVLKFTGPLEEMTGNTKLAVLGSALTGSLAFTFTDSFWFNAVEAEVYAMATLVMAALFYLGLLWERDMFAPRGNRWVILISFIIGLSFGIHFMGLLTIPAIGFLYFFKNYSRVTVRNFILANIVVVAVLLFIFKLLLPYTLSFFSVAELFFVNSLGMPFNSGTIAAGLAVIALFYFGIKYTQRKQWYQLNTLLLCLMFILIGFSSWMMLPVRANGQVIINENNPNNARELLAYYNREQYQETHLFYGPQFTEVYSGLDPDNPYIDDKPKYEKDEAAGKYIVVNDYENARQNTDDAHKAILPRMSSTQHAAGYLDFAGPLQFTIKPEYLNEEQLVQTVNEFTRRFNSGEIGNREYDQFLRQFRQYLEVERPSFISNLNYLFEFQIGYMYWRYFMWNFVGRQDDIQGKYSDLHGNWLSGIDFVDEPRLGSMENLPRDIKNNKGRNTYYFLPLILGLAGFFFHFKKDKKTWWVLLVFFLFTGIALKIYLNERPFEPRERDYALVGSFYVFTMWIGMGVFALFVLLKRKLKLRLTAPVATLIGLLVPVVLAAENWDDHDRSNRYTALAMAKMYLDSVDENAILFTYGDNDTFLLWYAQQIEGYRRDVRIINTQLLGTDWYIDQMRRKAWDSDPVPGQLEHRQYRYGTNDAVWHQPLTRDTMQIKNWLNWISSDDPRTKAELSGGQTVSTFPTQNLRIPVNRKNVLENNIIKPEDADLMVDHIDIEIGEEIIYKNSLLMLDLLANNDWERPIYFSGGSFEDEDYIWMKEYLQLEGLAYKLVPVKTPVDSKNPLDMGRIASDKMFEIVTSWDWGNMGNWEIYHDPVTRRNSINYRTHLARLVEALLTEGERSRAEVVLDLALEKMPVAYYGNYFLLEPYVTGYFEVGNPEKALQLWEQVTDRYKENLVYYSSWDLNRQYRAVDVIINDIEQYRSFVDLLIPRTAEEVASEKAEEFNRHLLLFRHFFAEDNFTSGGN